MACATKAINQANWKTKIAMRLDSMSEILDATHYSKNRGKKEEIVS
jgi:hypothetical protein